MKEYKSYFLLCGNIQCICMFLCLSVVFSCAQKIYPSTEEYRSGKTPNYADLDYWAAHPWKKDLSDSVPKPLLASYQQDSLVDVFFIHPTTLTDNDDQRWNADIDDRELNKKTDRTTILYQASVFNEHCRVFAPRYRQAHIKSFFLPDSLTKNYFDIAYDDVKSAFIYYLEHYNNGRPIIIASHSQGTKHAGRLLKEFFEGKALQNQLVCAYIIGLPVPDDYFITLKPCKDSLSTGCFVSWRTFKSGYTEPNFIARETFKCIVTNPLSWITDTTYVPASKNKGGVLRKFNKLIPHVVSAEVHNNILWTSKPNIPGKIFFTKKNYHIGDINLFYMNIRENVAARIGAFLKK